MVKIPIVTAVHLLLFAVQNGLLVASQNLQCRAANGDNCTPVMCPKTVVNYTCTITNGTAAGYTDWILPTGTCPTNLFPDKIRLSQLVNTQCSAQGSGGTPNTCGPYRASSIQSSDPTYCLSSILTVNITSTMNGSTVTCCNTNIFNTAITTVVSLATINVVGSPGPVIFLTITTATVSQLTVTWAPPTTGGTPTSYSVSINDSSSVVIADNGASLYNYTFTGLNSNTFYTASVVAINCAGTSHATTAMKQTLAPPPSNINVVYVFNPNNTLHQLEITWKPVGGNVTTYAVYVGGVLCGNTNCTTSTCFYAVLMSEPSTGYNISVASINGGGTGPMRVYHCCWRGQNNNVGLPTSPVLSTPNLIAVITGVTSNYRLTFDITPRGIVASDWGSILHFTKGGDCCNFGNRGPAFWFFPGTTRLMCRIDDFRIDDWGFDAYTLPLNIRTTVVLECDGTNVKLTVGEREYTAVQPSMRYNGSSLVVYAGDPWYTEANAVIENLYYEILPATHTDVLNNDVISSTVPNITSSNVTISCSFLTNESFYCVVCCSTDPSVPPDSSVPYTSNISGILVTVTLQGLSSDQMYYCKAKASNTSAHNCEGPVMAGVKTFFSFKTPSSLISTPTAGALIPVTTPQPTITSSVIKDLNVASIDTPTAVGISVAITFIFSFSLGVLVTTIIICGCYIPRVSSASSKSSHNYNVMCIGHKEIELESNDAYGTVQ